MFAGFGALTECDAKAFPTVQNPRHVHHLSSRLRLTEHAVTALISRRVKPGCERDFERVTEQLLGVAAKFPGYLGAQLVRPGDEPDVLDTLYHVVLAFDGASNLHAWEHSNERSLGLGATAPFIEGESRLRALEGLGLWFRPPQPFGPPRWKVAVVTWLGICPTVYVLFLISADALKSWWLFPRTALLTVVVVAVMTWVVAPRLTKLLRPWLFAPRKGV